MASPIIVISGDREILVLAENPTATAYDLNTGAVILSTKCLSGEVVPSPAYAGGPLSWPMNSRVFPRYRWPRASLHGAARTTFRTSQARWRRRILLSRPISSGVVNCYDLGTGRKLWTHEFQESFYPSPILAAGNVYAMDNRGTMHVFRASKTFVPVADAKLGEESLATPAFTGSTLFVRGKGNLYCVGAK